MEWVDGEWKVTVDASLCESSADNISFDGKLATTQLTMYNHSYHTPLSLRLICGRVMLFFVKPAHSKGHSLCSPGG